MLSEVDVEAKTVKAKCINQNRGSFGMYERKADAMNSLPCVHEHTHNASIHMQRVNMLIQRRTAPGYLTFSPHGHAPSTHCQVCHVVEAMPEAVAMFVDLICP